MDIKIFDIESYPNLFSVAAIVLPTEERQLMWICEDHNDIEAIYEWTRTNSLFVGYYNKGYDNPMLYYIVQNIKELRKMNGLEVAQRMKEVSNSIIDSPRNFKDIDPEVRKLMGSEEFKWLDLLSLFATIQRTSLKQISINLQYWNVQTLPYPEYKVLTPEEIKVVLDYNFNDVEITRLLFDKKKDDLVLRKDIIKRYGVDVLNQNDTGIAKMILNKYYSDATGLKYSDFKDKRSYWLPFKLDQLILREYNFRTDEFKAVQTWFENQTFDETMKVKAADGDDDEDGEEGGGYVLSSKGLEVSIALGGLHSKDKPGKFYTGNGRTIRDVDVASLYPKIMVNYGIKPKHCSPVIVDIINNLMIERLADKKAGRKSEANTKKIIINSIYGLLGSEYYWLRDNKALLSVTINGQLSVLRLIEDFQLAGFRVISTNTDGVTCDLEDSQIPLYNQIVEAWQKEFNYEVEFVDYLKYIRKDVNNYICQYVDKGKVEAKQKGKYFVTKLDLHKGYYYPVIPAALNKYFLEGVLPEDYIPTDKNIYNFMSSVKADEKKYKMKHITLDNSGEYGKLQYEVLQKSNRWVVSNQGGKLVKQETDEAMKERLDKAKWEGRKLSRKESTNKILQIDKDNCVTITNRVEDDNADSYDLKHQYYIQECWEVIRQIEPPVTQTTLF